MFRLAHISDPHLGPLPPLSRSDYFNKRIIGFLNWKGNRKHHMTAEWLDRLTGDLQTRAPDHIAVTGDLTNLAMKQEFAAGRAWLETLGPAERVSVVPGNHDAYIPGAFSRHGRQWAPYMVGDDAGDRLRFPYLRRREGVALIGISTAVAMPPLLAGGILGRGQSRRLRRMLEDPALADHFKVVMIHHPPHKGATLRQKALYDAARFRRAIRDAGADLILHGHTHLATFAHIPGPNGQVPVICVPAASNAPGILVTPARYNLFEITRTGGSWKCNWTERGFDPSSGDLVSFRDREPIGPSRPVSRSGLN